jgi:hypothetical protein
MSRYQLSRRNFLAGIGGAVGLAAFLRHVEAQEAMGPQDFRRLLFVQRPVGTWGPNWFPQGSGQNYALSPILQPLAAHRAEMVVFGNGLKLPYEGSKGGGHELGTTLMLTGVRAPNLYPGNGGDDPYNEGPNVDQIWVKQSDLLKGAPIESLQVSCDKRADTTEVSTRHMSYAAAHQPMDPYYQPSETYMRVFSSLMPGGDTAALAAARARKQSVLDFAGKDLARLRALSPASQKVTLDAFEDAIRATEMELDASGIDAVSCGVATPPEQVNVVDTGEDPYTQGGAMERDDEKHEKIGRLHFSVIKAAFRCDLTRVATFQWSPGTNHVSFGGMWDPDPSLFKIHHGTSHLGLGNNVNIQNFITKVETWYARILADFVTELKDAQDANGKSLFANTLLPYVTEVENGDHGWSSMPYLLLGGADTKLAGGQLWNNFQNGKRSTNDLWMACAKVFGLDDFVLGDNDLHTSALEGVFA